MNLRLGLLAPLAGLSLVAASVGVPALAGPEQPAPRVVDTAARSADAYHPGHAASDGVVGTIMPAGPDRRSKPRPPARPKVKIAFVDSPNLSYLQIGEPVEVVVKVRPKATGGRVMLQRRAPVRGWEDLRRARLRASAASFRLDTSVAGTLRYRVLLPRHKKRPKAASKPFRTSVFGTPPPIPPVPPPPPMPGPQGDPNQYAFMVESRGVPARWNGCVPITWGYNPTGASAAALTDVTEGVARLAAQTGYTFTFTGETDAHALSDELRTEPQLLISFGNDVTRPDQFEPGSNIAGRGGPRMIYPSNHPGDPQEITQGDVLLRTDGYSTALNGFGVGSRYGRLVLHELGHAVNLAHVTEKVQVMVSGAFPWTAAEHRGYNLGDISGLKALGTGAGCFTQPRR
ncbi:zinc metalloprotease [Nocardioides campestrisoli]|uniref:hypothetical protein n=1 Tax=Nocardioides campestrisoli TaxID=2736757 RepID=UPI00163DC88A|nr:hypothetical protein [Nocardioides campestrisoli]